MKRTNKKGKAPAAGHREWSSVVVCQTELPKIPLELYPYQKAWIVDSSRQKIAVKSRRVGFSFAAGLGAVLDCIERKQNVIVLSRGERQTKEFIEDSVAPHCRAIGVVSEYYQGLLPQTSIQANRVNFPNGSSIIALPANPDTARSYEGDVVLDEFGFHQDARKIFEAIIPSITRGYKFSIISTPNGQMGEYFELAKRAGLVDGTQTDFTWSPHRVDIHKAISEGFRDRNGKLLDAAIIRETCLDEEMFLQEYCCAFLSTASQWISPDLWDSCISNEATWGYPAGSCRNLYAGWDIARSKDLSVIWFIEQVEGICWTRGVIEMKNMPTPDQINELRRWMPQIQRLVIDKSSMGLAIFEQLQREYGSYKVEGVVFTLAHKQALAVSGKSQMEKRLIRLPDTAMIRHSFRSVKKTQTSTGQARFDAEHDEHFGHADHWWAYCLAQSAVQQKPIYGLLELQRQLQQALDAGADDGRRKFERPNPGPCPKCGEVGIAALPGGDYRCCRCAHQFGGVPVAFQGMTRRDILLDLAAQRLPLPPWWGPWIR